MSLLQTRKGFKKIFFSLLDFRIADKAAWTRLYNPTNSVSAPCSGKKAMQRQPGLATCWPGCHGQGPWTRPPQPPGPPPRLQMGRPAAPASSPRLRSTVEHKSNVGLEPTLVQHHSPVKHSVLYRSARGLRNDAAADAAPLHTCREAGVLPPEGTGSRRPVLFAV